MSATTAGYKMSEKQYASGNFTSDEVPHEIHVKMSKKIAQLTKVIYALNTKNDEHEALVDALKKQHAAELEKVLASSREKLARCQSLIGQDSEYRRRIGQLEGSLAEAQERQAASQREFADFKVRAESRERELAQQQAQKVGWPD
uniref:FAM184 domain-containing protein n=2 Tax=Macrostomum lignano TaxID=282301 RepID=A0A1I8GC72_9PLAT